VKRLRKPLERALRDAELDPGKLSAVILVGGATRMPIIRSTVAKLFGRFPLSHLNPDELVALGAAVQAGLKVRDAALDDVVMTDVCPYTLGIAAHTELSRDQNDLTMAPLIKRNTVVPVSRNSYFGTMQDNQTELKLMVFQGEAIRPDGNIKLGEMSVRVPRAPAGDEGIDVRFTYDINGILEVEVKIMSTEQKSTKVFQSRETSMSDAEIAARLKELAGIKIPPREQTANRAVIARAEHLYEEFIDNRCEEIGYTLRNFENFIHEADARKVDKARKEFSEFLDSMESAIFSDEPD
jgi:molecular chaperone HscC